MWGDSKGFLCPLELLFRCCKWRKKCFFKSSKNRKLKTLLMRTYDLLMYFKLNLFPAVLYDAWLFIISIYHNYTESAQSRYTIILYLVYCIKYYARILSFDLKSVAKVNKSVFQHVASCIVEGNVIDFKVVWNNKHSIYLFICWSIKRAIQQFNLQTVKKLRNEGNMNDF